MRFDKLFLLSVIMAGGLTFQQTASAQVGTITQHANETAHGTWFFNNANGKISFCVSRVVVNGIPSGKCSLPAVTTTSAAGFEVQVQQYSIWITSKSSENIYQCSYYLANNTTATPVVNCTLISSLLQLH